jgi:two-component system OmpR family response regulator
MIENTQGKERDRLYRFAGWTLDAATGALTGPAGEAVGLTAAEFDLLLCLARRPGQVLSREALRELTRSAGSAYDRAIDVQLSRLRRKLAANPTAGQIIRTVRGGGYLFAPSVERS